MGLKTHILLLTMGCFSLWLNPIRAQTDSLKPANKILYFEVLGIGGFQSLNYERMVFRALDSRILGSIAVGASCLIANKPRDPEFRFLLLQRANLAFGHKSWYLEIGGDLLLDRGKSYNPSIGRWRSWTSSFSLFYHFGVRYQKRLVGPYFKAYVFPIKDNGWTYDFLSIIGKDANPISEYPRTFWWGGFAAGYTF